MTTTEWPNGAIKTLAEVKRLLKLAKKEKQIVYKVRGKDLIKCVFDEFSHIEDDRRSALCTRSVLCTNSIKLDWYSLDKEYPVGGNFLFRNYWHAWGYKNRMNNGQVEKS